MPEEKDLEITLSEYRRIVQRESTPLSNTDKFLQKEDELVDRVVAEMVRNHKPTQELIEEIQKSKEDISSVVIDKPWARSR